MQIVQQWLREAYPLAILGNIVKNWDYLSILRLNLQFLTTDFV